MASSRPLVAGPGPSHPRAGAAARHPPARSAGAPRHHRANQPAGVPCPSSRRRCRPNRQRPAPSPPAGGLPLALAFCPDAPVLVGAVPGRPAPGGRVAEVLVPARGVAPGLRRQQPADPRRLDRPDPGQRPGSGGGRSGGGHLGLPAALALGPWAPGPGSPGFPSPEPRVAGAAGRLAGAPCAAPHRPGAGPNGRVATAGGLKVCAPCIDPRLAAHSASGVLPPRFRSVQTGRSVPSPPCQSRRCRRTTH